MVLLTGASGFLGKMIRTRIFKDAIITLGRDNKSDIICDLSKEVPVLPEVDLVIHAAGKAHSVPRTDEERQNFFDVNLTGTIHLLEALSKKEQLPKSFLLISSVAVYGLEHGKAIDEKTVLKAEDAYGLSKIKAENVVLKWCKAHDVKCTILRLPLLAGANPPGNLGGMIKGIQRGYYYNIAKGQARKSIVLTTDVADIIPKAAEIGGIYNLTDGYHPSFSELSISISKQLNKKVPGSIPEILAVIIARVGDLLGERAPINSKKLRKITSDLIFDDSLARIQLGWNPHAVLDGFKIT